MNNWESCNQEITISRLHDIRMIVKENIENESSNGKSK